MKTKIYHFSMACRIFKTPSCFEQSLIQLFVWNHTVCAGFYQPSAVFRHCENGSSAQRIRGVAGFLFHYFLLFSDLLKRPTDQRKYDDRPVCTTAVLCLLHRYSEFECECFKTSTQFKTSSLNYEFCNLIQFLMIIYNTFTLSHFTSHNRPLSIKLKMKQRNKKLRLTKKSVKSIRMGWVSGNGGGGGDGRGGVGFPVSNKRSVTTASACLDSQSCQVLNDNELTLEWLVFCYK